MTEVLVDQPDAINAASLQSEWPALPTETEIYILPDGRVVVADLPMELATLLANLGNVEPCTLLSPAYD